MRTSPASSGWKGSSRRPRVLKSRRAWGIEAGFYRFHRSRSSFLSRNHEKPLSSCLSPSSPSESVKISPACPPKPSPPRPSSPRGRGGRKAFLFLVLFPSLPPGERGQGSEGFGGQIPDKFTGPRGEEGRGGEGRRRAGAVFLDEGRSGVRGSYRVTVTDPATQPMPAVGLPSELKAVLREKAKLPLPAARAENSRVIT